MAGRFVPGDFYEGYDPFVPRFHPDRLSQPAKVKKPSKIFVCSMADLFGDWVYAQWIMRVRDVAAIVAPWHTYIFLTKNPKRLKDFNPWPSNCWVGTTVTNQDDANARLGWLLQANSTVRFVSHEPLLFPIDMVKAWWVQMGDSAQSNTTIQWGIIGARTGPGAVRPKTGWVQGLVDQYRAAAVPLFLKDNLKWPEKIQEWPT